MNYHYNHALIVNTVEEQVYYEMKIDCTTQDYFIESTSNRLSQSSANSTRHSSTAKTPEGNENQTEQEVHNELLSTFTPELAHTAYVMFCRLAGGYVFVLIILPSVINLHLIIFSAFTWSRIWLTSNWFSDWELSMKHLSLLQNSKKVCHTRLTNIVSRDYIIGDLIIM